MKHYFITAIGTDSGKTVVSSIFCEALDANYWKPIQCGFPTDKEKVISLVSNPKTNFYDETYLLEMPASPHIAAKYEGVEINLTILENDFNTLTKTTIIEGAGGLLVPINKNETIADIIQRFKIPVILVANLYLGSINHTLLSIQELNNRKIKVEGIVFNGEDAQGTKEIILEKSGFKELLHLKNELVISKDTILNYANEIRKKLS